MRFEFEGKGVWVLLSVGGKQQSGDGAGVDIDTTKRKFGSEGVLLGHVFSTQLAHVEIPCTPGRG